MKKILSTKQHNTLGLDCITGMKTLAMIFIIAGHACMFIASGPVMDADAWDRLVRAPANAFMLNNTLLVDTFLMLSAFLFSRLLLVELDKRRGKLNVIPILVFRYIRVTPAYLVVILFYMTWLPKIGEGPLWEDRLQLEQQRCMDSWWANILYINNYVNTDKMCMFQSWYLSVDTQLFFIAPFFIYSLWRWRKFGPALISVALIISLVIPSVITYKDKLDPTLLFYAKEFTDIILNYYFNEAYIKTHMKMIIYFMGILTGYVLHRIQTENYQFSYLMKTIGWLTSVILGTVTTFSVTIFYQEWYQYNELEAAAYISLHKLSWGIVNGWLIIACASGNGGILGRLLTWKFLAPFSRLTFCAYLVNGIIELYYVGELRHPLHITFFTVMATSISHIVLTFLLALFLCLTFESPLHGIEKILLRLFGKLKKSEFTDNYHKQVIRTGRGETLRWAVCVPSACHANSVQSFVSSVLAHTVSNTTRVEVTEKDCYTRRPLSINSLDVAYLSVLLLFLAILFFSTIFETYVIYWGKNKESVAQSLIISFSVINNMKKILSTKQHNTLGLDCITGMKTLAMIFIIAGHACMFIASGPVMDADAWDRLVRAPANAFMLNNTLLVDTFLMLSAFLFSRLLLVELDKRRGKLNVIPILVFRYIRVTPAYLVVILFYMTWLPKIGEGPLWEDRLQLEQQRCMDSWWANILYINNYVNTDKMCMFQSWYLSVDTQLFFIAPFFIYSLWRWRKFGPALISVALIISLVIPSVITYKDKLDPTLLFYAKEFTDIILNYYFNEAYIKTHMKMIIYFMGILTGYVLHRIQTENYQFSYLMKPIGWLTSVILGTVTTFSVTIFYQEWYQYNELEAAAYISLHKLSWGIVNGWLIIACATGNGGILGRLLTWKFLAPFSRLTFCAYLVNGIIELYYVGELRHPLHITFFTVMATSISHIVLTFLLALFLCLTFESPLHGIEKILLRLFARPVLSDNARKDESTESSRNTSQSKLDS